MTVAPFPNSPEKKKREKVGPTKRKQERKICTTHWIYYKIKFRFKDENINIDKNIES